MEEKLMKDLGFREMNSSELNLRGGADGSFFETIFKKIKAVVDFIADYVPNFLKGFKEGFGVSIF